MMDLHDHQIVHYDAVGRFERSWGRLGQAQGHFDFRSTDFRGIQAGIGLDVAPDGSVLVAELANHRVQRFSRRGRAARWLGALREGRGRARLAGRVGT